MARWARGRDPILQRYGVGGLARVAGGGAAGFEAVQAAGGLDALSARAHLRRPADAVLCGRLAGCARAFHLLKCRAFELKWNGAFCTFRMWSEARDAGLDTQVHSLADAVPQASNMSATGKECHVC